MDHNRNICFGQGTVGLRVSRQLLIQRVRVRIPSPTLLSQEREEKKGEKNARKIWKRKDSILSSKREQKGLDSKDVDVDERPVTQKQKPTSFSLRMNWELFLLCKLLPCSGELYLSKSGKVTTFEFLCLVF